MLPSNGAWKVSNGDKIENSWQVSEMQLFSDYGCSIPIIDNRHQVESLASRGASII